MKKFVKSAVLLTAASMWMGCGVELSGEEGNLNFRYLGTEMTAGASAGTLAVGAKVDVEVREVDGEDALAIGEAYSEAADVIDVISAGQMSFTLEAKTAGTARIRAEARSGDGETLEDSVEIRAAEAVEIEFRSRCTDDLFVTDSGAEFGFRLNDMSGTKLTGYGFYPAAVEPAEGGTVKTGDKIDVLELSTGSEPGVYDLVSDLESNPWTFELVSPEQIDFVEVNREDDETVDFVDVGEEVGVALIAMEANGKTVCGPATAAVELTTETPEICQPSYRFWSSLHFVFVEGVSEGMCEVNLQVADTALERTFTVEVR